MSANDIRYGRRGGHEVDGGRVVGNGRCLNTECGRANPPDRWLFCSDECSEAARAAGRSKRGTG